MSATHSDEPVGSFHRDQPAPAETVVMRRMRALERTVLRYRTYRENDLIEIYGDLDEEAITLLGDPIISQIDEALNWDNFGREPVHNLRMALINLVAAVTAARISHVHGIFEAIKYAKEALLESNKE